MQRDYALLTAICYILVGRHLLLVRRWLSMACRGAINVPRRPAVTLCCRLA